MQINTAFTLRSIYNKYILMPIRSNGTSNDPILLNDVATRIWVEAPGCNSAEELADEIAHIYKLPGNSAQMLAVKSFIKQMIEIGLLSDLGWEANNG